MADAVIVSAARTAIGTARKGSLADIDVFELAKASISEALKRSSVPAEDVDDIIMGESLQGGGCVARYAAVDLGLTDIPGLAHNRHCASGMAPIQTAAAGIRAGMDRVVIAGGAESITHSPTVMKKLPGAYAGVEPWLSPSHPATPDAPTMDMSITVGWNTAVKAGVSREEQDDWAYHSHMRAVAATDEGRFRDEIFAMEVPVRGKRGETRTFDVDEHPRRDTTPESIFRSSSFSAEGRTASLSRSPCEQLRKRSRTRASGRASPSVFTPTSSGTAMRPGHSPEA